MANTTRVPSAEVSTSFTSHIHSGRHGRGDIGLDRGRGGAGAHIKVGRHWRDVIQDAQVVLHEGASHIERHRALDVENRKVDRRGVADLAVAEVDIGPAAQARAASRRRATSRTA
jgi:hypothetical protein